jgi:acetyl-CoA carboxylase biotin carboxyl carrier protein
MDIRKVKKLIELLEESGISELEISEGEESAAARGRPGCGADDPRHGRRRTQASSR